MAYSLRGMPRAMSARSASPAVRLPGDINIWVFVLGDLLIFTFYFVVFMIYRSQKPALFLDSQQHLSLTAGVVNTLVLLASSRFVAMAAAHARRGNSNRAIRATVYAGLCGLAFIVVKSLEWYSEASRGFTLARNDFFMFYYTMTGVHLFHVLLGLIALGIIVMELRGPGVRRIWVVEAGAIFWHLVDLLWIVIFALLYVMR